MAPTTEAPKFSKKRKLGKGKKKAWRAAKINDLEEFLDDERRQRETGGLVSEKTSEKLFFVDTAPAKKLQLRGKPVSKESRRTRPLRSTALLEPNPHIKTVITPLKENYRKGKKTLKILDSINARAASKVRVAAVQQRQSYVKEKIAAKKLKRQLPVVSADEIWNDDLMETAKVKRPRKLLRKPSKLPATVVPHPGASINPSYGDHQDLLQKAVDVEENKRKSALRTVNVLQRVNRKDVATQETYLAEMSAGLIDDTESEEDDEENGTEDVQSSIRVPHRKSKRQRKAEVKVGEQRRKKKAEADKNRRESMVFRIRSLKSEIRKQNVKTQEKLEKTIKLKEEEPFRTKRLGKAKYEEPVADLKLSEELVASMREFKPEGNLMDDVYTGMLRRNIMAPRSKLRRQRKLKIVTYPRKSHKERT